jgi:hypothetical protein
MDRIKEERLATPLADEMFADLYVDVIALAIRAFTDILKSQDHVSCRKRLIEAISLIPSYAVQCQLLADLALVHALSSKHQDFEQLVGEYVLDLLENCEDAESRAQTVIKIAPSLFRYERKMMADEVSRLSPSRQDAALAQVVTHLLAKRLPDDPIDLDSLDAQLEFVEARRICEIVGQMNSDHVIYAFIERLVDALVRKDPRKREKCILPEKQALTIAKELNMVLQSKLPDPNNIQHPGYRTASQASIARLRASAELRAACHWDELVPSWQEIIQAVRDIPNVADRTLVMAWAGRSIHNSEPGLAHGLLEDAKSHVYQIPNVFDRANRLSEIAESWAGIDDKESAKVFLEEAMSLLKAWQWDRNRDQVTGRILQLAHSLDPEFAASLTTYVDNPIIQHDVRRNLVTHDLRRRPADIAKEIETSSVQDVLGKAAWRLLESFCSGKGYAQDDAVVGRWVRLSIDSEFDDAFKVAAWAIENTLSRTSQLHSSTLGDTFRGLLDSLELIRFVGDSLLLAEKRAEQTGFVSPALPAGLELFPGGSQAEATAFVRKWLTENARSYVRIHDPYFTDADLDLIKCISPDIRVDVLTLWRAQTGISVGDRAIRRRYQDAWNVISDQVPPETHIYVIGTSSGDGPIHDRYIITEGGGLSLGPSIEGLGRKDTSVHILDADEAMRVEREFVIPLLLGTTRQWNGEKLVVTPVTL